ncbi:hypothetical protein [Streptomyces sp. Da 82-17]|uniref:hypothetical protein n=1 Tax=Streptomyces sp. Da 82-17 TaxID=3377116 RepID=UPI0038D4B0D3
MHERDVVPGARPDPRDPPAPAPGPYPADRPLPWLAGTAAAYTLLQLVLLVPGTGLGWDETVYVSQVSPQAPAAFFSAPRARGITFLVAPVTELTTSVPALRVYLALLSGLGLFLALWVWRTLLPTAVLAVGGGLFATIWVTFFYGPQVMPNLWVAYAALAATGCLLRTTRAPDGRMLCGIAGAVAFAALLRPADALWLCLALALAALLLTRGRPRLRLLLVLAGGLVAGSAEWIVEAYVRYGGLAARLDRASEVQGHLGAYFAVDDHARALSGRTLCRPCDVAWEHPVASLWFLLLPLLVAAGAWAAARTPHRRAVLLATGTGLALAAPYLFTVGYAAPRFLLPAYALLTLPVAYGLTRAVRAARAARPAWRRALLAGLALALLGHLAIQYKVLDGLTRRVRHDTARYAEVAAELRAQGVRPPCVVTGMESVRVAFRVGCSSRQPGGNDASITPEGLAEAAGHQPVAVLLSGDQQPMPYARDWRVVRLPDLPHLPDYRAHLSPTARPGPPGGPVVTRRR